MQIKYESLRRRGFTGREMADSVDEVTREAFRVTDCEGVNLTTPEFRALRQRITDALAPLYYVVEAAK